MHIEPLHDLSLQLFESWEFLRRSVEGHLGNINEHVALYRNATCAPSYIIDSMHISTKSICRILSKSAPHIIPIAPTCASKNLWIFNCHRIGKADNWKI